MAARKLLHPADEDRIENVLIPEAEAYADARVSVQAMIHRPGKWPEDIKDKWNRCFHAQMDVLAKAEGIRF